MGISEILIIYLTIGAPIGVFAIIRSKNSLTKNLFGILAVNVILWPVVASMDLVPRSASGNGSKYFIDGGRNSTTTSEKAGLVFIASLESLGDRHFRRQAFEDFDRFAALSDAIQIEATPAEICVPEIFKIAGHPMPTMASKCLYRQNRRKLVDHRDRAFADLTALAGKLGSRERTVYNSALEAARTELFDRAIS